MKVRNLLSKTVETVAQSDCESQKIMIKGSYMKQMSSGIYSLFAPTKRITKKVENIIRDEMDRIDGQEVMFPVVMPASLWKSSGRFYSEARWCVFPTGQTKKTSQIWYSV